MNANSLALSVARKLLVVSVTFASWGAFGQSAGSSDRFQSDVAPILVQSCVKCHGDGMAMSKLRLDSESALLRGGASGAAVVKGKSGDSLLVKRILGLTDAPRMPMGAQPLSPESVAAIRAWIDKGEFSASEQQTPSVSSSNKEPGSPSPQASSPVFAETIRPLLASRCYGCHGPQLQQNGLRVDSLSALLKGSESGPVIVPGHSEKSRLMRRLMSQERPMMPYGGPALSKAEIESFRKWIDSGAPGPDSSVALVAPPAPKHWAYVKPVVPALPNVTAASWCRNPIDRFVLAKLEHEKLSPAAEAEKGTLLRRVYLDLIGVPPTPAELDSFLSDKSPDAYEKVVDRLLQSPHYGERWARPWLDLARYADSNGYEKDSKRVAWEYRDWVIRALNADMSFRDFTIDQIAGDMLPKPTKDQLIATGFNRNSMLNQEGGIDVHEYYWLSLVDRVNTTASVWLGSTLGCAQCHNHKFDPFTQKDYYKFLAFFDNGEYTVGGNGDHWTIEPELELPTPDQKVKSDKLRERAASLKTKLDTQTPALAAAQKGWEQQQLAIDSTWHDLEPKEYRSSGGATLRLLTDHSLLASGTNPQADTYTITGGTAMQNIAGVRLEVLPDPSLPHNGPGRDNEGNFFLSDFEIQISQANSSAPPQIVTWKSAKADESQQGYDVKNLAKKDNQLRGWAIDQSAQTPLRRQAIFMPEKAFGFPGGTIIRLTMKHEMRHATRNIGRFRISLTTSPNPKKAVELPAALRPVLAIADDKRSDEDRKKMAAAYRAVSPLLAPERKELASIEKDIDDLGIVTALILREKPGNPHPSTFIRERGSYMSKGEEVSANVPSALNPLPEGTPANRLALAQWLASEDNPLTARVAVNHVWEALFGHGIVETSEDFGTQGDLPTHPELLDWLATSFMQNGWSMKKLQRLIVTSATYRQSSKASPELIAHDPYNKLYARGPRFRVEAEMVHDIALSVSGLLTDKMYGPSVFPYQPNGIWDIPYSKDTWTTSSGVDYHRRSVYTFLRRSAPYPSLVTYDAPSREFCTVRRVRTNTPLQALTSLNDPFFFSAAQAMAKRMITEGGSTPQSRIDYGFRLSVSRLPTSDERKRVLAFYLQQRNERQHSEKVSYTPVALRSGGAPDSADLNAWIMVANVLLNMDETISKE
jgi:mono/diheme cytochrome c family protein